jgi:DNA repair ATPase RecN
MEQVLNQILVELKELNNRVINLAKNQEQFAKNQEQFANNQEQFANNQEQLMKNQEKFAEDQARMERKLDAVYDQTAELTEFRTETRQNLNAINNNIRFLLHKEMETEKEIFFLKEKKVK